MSYFSLPSLPIDTDLHTILTYTASATGSDICINKTLSFYLKHAKGQIDNKANLWDKYKKYTNVYEYIHTSIPQSKNGVCKIKPLSRSFYKMIEICRTLRLIDSLPEDKCKTYHFAEGPGGFIEAIAYLRDNKDDNYLGMTLLNNKDISIPGWSKSQEFLEKNTNVTIETGITMDGNMLAYSNLTDCHNKHSNSCNLVTGDGGVDFTADFNNQERSSLKLMFAQVAYAIACQKTGGVFILKMFDTFTEGSVDILYILSRIYEQVYLFKPNTSRTANSEKYVICKNYRLQDNTRILHSMTEIIRAFKDNIIPTRFISSSIPYMYITALQEINAIYGQAQLECINQTLILIESSTEEVLSAITKLHIHKCVQWCCKNKLPYNKHLSSPFGYNNTFMPSYH